MQGPSDLDKPLISRAYSMQDLSDTALISDWVLFVNLSKHHANLCQKNMPE